MIHRGKKGAESSHVGHTAHIISMAVSSDGKFLVRRIFSSATLRKRNQLHTVLAVLAEFSEVCFLLCVAKMMLFVVVGDLLV